MLSVFITSVVMVINYIICIRGVVLSRDENRVANTTRVLRYTANKYLIISIIGAIHGAENVYISGALEFAPSL
jgi:hypothetical protein